MHRRRRVVFAHRGEELRHPRPALEGRDSPATPPERGVRGGVWFVEARLFARLAMQSSGRKASPKPRRSKGTGAGQRGGQETLAPGAVPGARLAGLAACAGGEDHPAG
jgi:hypothetical protein